MILKEVVNWLLENGYLQIVNGQFVVLKKLNQEALSQPEVKETAKSPPIDKRATWNKFVEDCAIPYLATTSMGNYYLRHYSPGGAMELVKIIYKKGVDYSMLVESTKRYYQTTAFKKTLLNYLREGLWEEVYKDYIANPKPSSIGENPFEA